MDNIQISLKTKEICFYFLPTGNSELAHIWLAFASLSGNKVALLNCSNILSNTIIGTLELFSCSTVILQNYEISPSANLPFRSLCLAQFIATI
jgi:hypothetical protein